MIRGTTFVCLWESDSSTPISISGRDLSNARVSIQRVHPDDVQDYDAAYYCKRGNQTLRIVALASCSWWRRSLAESTVAGGKSTLAHDASDSQLSNSNTIPSLLNSRDQTSVFRRLGNRFCNFKIAAEPLHQWLNHTFSRTALRRLISKCISLG